MKQGLFAELKRRHVYRVAVAYAVVGWLVIEIATQVFPTFHMPDWAPQLVIFLIILGFPVTLVMAWAFEMTPEGVRRTKPAESPEARAPEQHRKVGRTLDYVIIGVLALALLLALWRPWPSHPAASSAASTAPPAGAVVPGKSIAVLPFENLSPDKNNAYFADGMQDLILTKLADIGDLAVISRTSTMKYGSHPVNLQAIGKQLGVATILEGSVQKSGDQVLVNVQLIDARNDHHIWANSYQRTLDNVFGVEGEVAEKIANALKAKLSPAQTQRLATALSGNTDANDLYLRGEYFARHGTINYDTTAWKQAIAYYRKAIAKAPNFAQARARLSLFESRLAWFGGGGDKAAPIYADALVQAEQALQLAPDLADAHLALGYYDYYGKGDYVSALKAFSAALALRPNDTGALAAKAYVLRRQGKLNDAIDAFKKALTLDPRNTSIAFQMGGTYMQASHYPEAEQAFQRALALDPTNTNAINYYASTILFRSGDLTRALDEVRGDKPGLKLQRLTMLTYARRYADALALLQSMPDTPDTFSDGNGGPKALQLAYVYYLSGDSAKARALYAKALPQARAQYQALQGSPITNQALALSNIAWAELGQGLTSAGLADTARVQTIAEHGSDQLEVPLLMLACSEQYAFAGRPDKAVPLLAATLVSPTSGDFYSPLMLWIDPHWDPIRKTPAFQALEKKYAKFQPSTVPGAAKG